MSEIFIKIGMSFLVVIVALVWALVMFCGVPVIVFNMVWNALADVWK